MPGHFADRLLAAVVKKKTPCFVGIDPVYSRLPTDIRENKSLNDETDVEVAVDAVYEYCRRVIRAVAPHVAGIKLNTAFFEPYWWDGVETYYNLIQEAKTYDLIVIADVKRGDVGHSAERYAEAHSKTPDFLQFEGTEAADAVTVNGYLGLDGIQPFAQEAAQDGRGVFVLVRTTNESAAEVQDLLVQDGKTVAEHLADLVAKLAASEGLLGHRGYSAVGAVVGAKDAEAAAKFRAALPQSVLLVPGFGAQGLTAETIKPYFKPDGTGAIVSASRSVIYAYEDAAKLDAAGGDWEKCVAQAAETFKNEVAAVVQVV